MGRQTRRVASFRRRTRGTEVAVEFELDGAGRSEVDTPFELLNMLLEMMSGHGGMDLRMSQRLNEHAVEGYAMDDLATALAEALRRSLGARPKIRQFGSEILPVGDCLVLVAVDMVSPPVFHLGTTFRAKEIDGLPVDLLRRFLTTLVDRMGAAVHVRMLAGHHDSNKVKAIFLALGRAIAVACEPADREGAREVAADLDYGEEMAFALVGDDTSPSGRSAGAEAAPRERRRRRRAPAPEEDGAMEAPDDSVGVVFDAEETADAEVEAGRESGDEAGDSEVPRRNGGRRRRRGRRGGRGRRRADSEEVAEESNGARSEPRAERELPERAEERTDGATSARNDRPGDESESDAGEEDRRHYGRRGRGRATRSAEPLGADRGAGEDEAGTARTKDSSPAPQGAETGGGEILDFITGDDAAPDEAAPATGRRASSRGRRRR